MQTTDILAGKPFTDKNLVQTITALENQTPDISTIAYATFANPSTTERTLFLSGTQTAADKLYCTIDAVVNLTSNLSGQQDFTFKLYIGSEIVATSLVAVPDALNTMFSVRLNGSIMYSRTNSTELEYVGNLVATPISTSATADVSTITTVNTQIAPIPYSDLAGNFATKLTCTAETGTATTSITVLGGRATFDKHN